MTVRIRAIADTVTDVNWRLRGTCCYEDPDLWFPAPKSSAPNVLAQVAEAKRLCAGCPVLQDCLTAVMAEEGGKAAENRYGIRGGLTPGERFRRQRQATRRPGARSQQDHATAA